MRKDFSKLLVERARQGGKSSRKGRSPREEEELPKRQSMKKPHLYDRKSLNENLNPLKRFLDGAVGRKWDNVYSEICETINRNNTVQQHVLEHLWQYVVRHIIVEGKKIFFNDRSSYQWGRRELFDKQLYIHPKTGILKKYHRKKEERKNIPYRDEFNLDLNVFATDKSMLVFHEDEFYKVYQNKETKKWEIFNKASAAHARLDFNGMNIYRARAIYRVLDKWWKKLSSHSNTYIKTTIKLYIEWIESYHREQLALEKKKVSNERGTFE